MIIFIPSTYNPKQPCSVEAGNNNASINDFTERLEGSSISYNEPEIFIISVLIYEFSRFNRPTAREYEYAIRAKLGTTGVQLSSL